ncbi:MAG: transposase [Planctomycetes bacterium]|nr:transposase [Planctomycetota bacterium]MCH8119856.1 transposase [Planctomycetota bacterium]
MRPLVNIYYKYKKLNRLYADVKVIHIILDNYVIHTSKITQKAVEKFNGKIVLHFLPPYCPDDNKIERCVWRELHANVTRNHKCRNMNELMHEFVAISQSEIEQ